MRKPIDNQLTIPRKIYRYTGRTRRKLNNYLTSVTDKQILRELEIQNPIIKEVVLSSTISFRKIYQKYLLNLEYFVHHFTGNLKLGGKSFNLLYIGDGCSIRYFIDSFFLHGEVDHLPLGRITSPNLSIITDPEISKEDLIIFEMNINDRWAPPYEQWVRTPRWVRMVYQGVANEDAKDFIHQFKKNNRSNYSKVKRSGFFPVISTQKQDLDFFYHRMYLPLIKNRYQDFGDRIPLEFCEKLMFNGFLLFSCLPDGEKVAGILVITCGKTLYGVINGVLDGNESLCQMGALSSLYIFSMEHSHNNHYFQVDMGEVRPMENDGVYIHKKRWGFLPQRSPWLTTDWLFWVPNKSIEAFELIKSNQFLPQFAEVHGDQIELLCQSKN